MWWMACLCKIGHKRKCINIISTKRVAWGNNKGTTIPQERKRKGSACVIWPWHLSFGKYYLIAHAFLQIFPINIDLSGPLYFPVLSYKDFPSTLTLVVLLCFPVFLEEDMRSPCKGKSVSYANSWETSPLPLSFILYNELPSLVLLVFLLSYVMGEMVFLLSYCPQ
jgi:hypothetical protein